ncbi:MAG: HAMP domain-containing histidine kinase [Thermoleophilaceae bacterium]|nr:HAMP domain-containing histidine kinase [Thermoleophilaceae bacterium]
MTLRTRIAAAGTLAVGVTILLAAVTVYVGVRAELRGEVDHALRDVADGVQLRFAGPPPFDRGLLRRRAEPYGGATGYVQLVTNTGQALPPPGVVRARVPLDSDARDIAGRGSGEHLSDMTVGGTHLRVLTRGVPGGGAIQVARPLTEVDDQLGGILLVLALVSAGGVALAAGLGVLLARTALAPIGRFTSRTEAVAADPDVSRRIEVGEADDELSRLARSFNATLDELERSVESQRQLVADASHELRTPIASLRANIQTLDQAERLPPGDLTALRADIVEELDELTALVADVVELARGAKPGESLDDVRLDQVVEAAVERARARAGDRAEIRARLEPVVVVGEPDRIQRAVSNLLDNAVKWSPPGGLVDVALADGVLTVRDHGAGFDEGDLGRVFERFYRADRARGKPGSGLGLAIVKQAAEAHGGRVEAENAPGGGALLRLSFGPATAVERVPLS